MLMASRRSLMVGDRGTVASDARPAGNASGGRQREVDGCAGHEPRPRWAPLAPTGAPRRPARHRGARQAARLPPRCTWCSPGSGSTSAWPTMLLIYTLTIMAALVGPLPGSIGVADASLGALLIAERGARRLSAAGSSADSRSACSTSGSRSSSAPRRAPPLAPTWADRPSRLRPGPGHRRRRRSVPLRHGSGRDSPSDQSDEVRSLSTGHHERERHERATAPRCNQAHASYVDG